MSIEQRAVPLKADAKAVEQQYGDFAELDAATRAKAAAKMGRQDVARKWAKVEDSIEDENDD